MENFLCFFCQIFHSNISRLKTAVLLKFNAKIKYAKFQISQLATQGPPKSRPKPLQAPFLLLQSTILIFEPKCSAHTYPNYLTLLRLEPCSSSSCLKCHSSSKLLQGPVKIPLTLPKSLVRNNFSFLYNLNHIGL